PPRLAQIHHISWKPQSPCGDREFRIEESDHEAASSIYVSPDVAVCEACLRELFDPMDRRYLYPFLNCTRCGRRLTIIQRVPYARVNTTMPSSVMCSACRSEYEDPGNRRFHAQPTACPTCGPRLLVADADGKPIELKDPLAHVVDVLRQGKIGALKGLGGYHLICDASNQNTVGILRTRKYRDEKPFALMARDLAAARALCEVSPAEASLLSSPSRPIVLLRKRPDAVVAAGVAPGNPFLGIMLPYTPLHYLLMHAVGSVPLVMTSGNR